MKTLNVTLLQSDLIWENPSENIKAFTIKLNKLKQTADVIVLPEMFTTGFSKNAKGLAEKMTGKSVTWMRNKAKKLDALILGSLIVEDEGRYYNRLIAAFPNGDFKYYNKHHLFTLSGEDKIFTAGRERLQFNYKGWHICPLICYDLRFPVWSRNTTNYDVLIYIANWPKPRINAWDSLLKARAIENMSYVVGVNRVGVDDNNLEYSGHSAVYNCLGKPLAVSEPNKEEMLQIGLKKASLLETREKLQFLDDKDSFEFS